MEMSMGQPLFCRPGWSDPLHRRHEIGADEGKTQPEPGGEPNHHGYRHHSGNDAFDPVGAGTTLGIVTHDRRDFWQM